MKTRFYTLGGLIPSPGLCTLCGFSIYYYSSKAVYVLLQSKLKRYLGRLISVSFISFLNAFKSQTLSKKYIVKG